MRWPERGSNAPPASTTPLPYPFIASTCDVQRLTGQHGLVEDGRGMLDDAVDGTTSPWPTTSRPSATNSSSATGRTALSDARRLSATGRARDVVAAGTVMLLSLARTLLPRHGDRLTLAFARIVLVQLFNALDARADDGPLLGRFPLRDRTLWLCLAGLLAVHLPWAPKASVRSSSSRTGGRCPRRPCSPCSWWGSSRADCSPPRAETRGPRGARARQRVKVE